LGLGLDVGTFSLGLQVQGWHNITPPRAVFTGLLPMRVRNEVWLVSDPLLNSRETTNCALPRECKASSPISHSKPANSESDPHKTTHTDGTEVQTLNLLGTTPEGKVGRGGGCTQ